MVLPVSDGVVTLRAFTAADAQTVLDGRDEEWRRWLGPGAPDPAPTACIEVAGAVVGWIDADGAAGWLQPGEVNVGYSVFRAHRGRGHAARAVRLLAGELGEWGFRRMVLVIDVENVASRRVARAAGARVVAGRAVHGLGSSVVYARTVGERAPRRRGATGHAPHVRRPPDASAQADGEG